jgi:hypothetical protein
MTASAVETRPLVREVKVTDDELRVVLADGRKLAVPLAWFPRLLAASPEDRDRYEILGDGEGIHWTKLDEDLSTSGLLRGVRSRTPAGPEARSRS